MMGKDLASGFLRLRAAAEGKVSSVAVPVTFLVAFLEERKVKTRTLYEPNAKGAAPKSVQAFRGSATRRGGRSGSTSPTKGNLLATRLRNRQSSKYLDEAKDANAN